MRNLRRMKVVYWVNVSESFCSGLPTLSQIKGHYTVVVLVLHICNYTL